MARNRDEIVKDIQSSKKSKLVALVLAVIFGGLGVFYHQEQKAFEQELLILDKGQLDQMVLQ